MNELDIRRKRIARKKVHLARSVKLKPVSLQRDQTIFKLLFIQVMKSTSYSYVRLCLTILLFCPLCLLMCINYYVYLNVEIIMLTKIVKIIMLTKSVKIIMLTFVYKLLCLLLCMKYYAYLCV